MRVVILHAYSALNAGDGLLVDETLEMLRASFGPDLDITVVASRPETFDYAGVHMVGSRPSWRGYTPEFVRTMIGIREFDLVVGVGGGYLRAGHPKEAAKTLLVHGPQLIAASRSGDRAIYLSQSIGPIRFGLRRVFAALLSRVGTVAVRDDRSAREFDVPSVQRLPDLALLGQDWQPRSADDIHERPVLSSREIRGTVPVPVRDLAELMRPFDGYVQSRGASNDDAAAVESLAPASILTRPVLLGQAGPRRVVVAVRMHACLMALAAGHYVVHLSYERKGFGAFGDLNLGPFVHNVFSFDPGEVHAQVRSLLEDPEARRAYDEKLASARPRLDALSHDLRDRLELAGAHHRSQ